MNQRVLIVDDERLIRDMLARALKAYDMEVHTAEDGQAAVDMMDELQPDLLLLDLMMPRMDGFDVLRHLGESDTRRQVIVLTARASQEVLQEALEAGADDYISKPFHLGEVVARCKAHLRIAAYAQELETQRRDGEALLAISHRLTGRLDLAAILQEVTLEVTSVLATDRCSVVLLHEEGQRGRIVAASDDAGLTEQAIEISAYPEIRRCIETREPVIVGDITADPLFDPVKDQITALGVRSVALFPMLAGPHCIGVLFLRSKSARETLQERERRFGQIVANAAAVAVHNASSFREMEEETRRSTEARAVVERRLQVVQRYEEVFEASADGMIACDQEGCILFMNKQAEALTGIDRVSAAGRPFASLVTDGDSERVAQLLARAEAGEFGEHTDLGVVGDRILSVKAASIPGEAGYSLALRDVTRIRAISHELAETKDYLQSLIDASPDAILATDLEGEVRVYNKAAEALFGHPAATVIDHLHVSKLYPPGKAAEVMAAVRSEGHGGPGRLVPPIRQDVVHMDGSPIPVLMSAALVRVNGVAVATVGVLRDLRERIAMEGELAQTKERLQESERMALLAELAGTAAHELNQPLTSVMGYAELLKRRMGDEDPNLKAASTILEQAERMAAIVKQIGRITKYETKPYVGGTRILDLEASTADADDFD